MVPLLFGFRPSVWQMHYCYLSFVRTFCTFFWRTLPTWHGAFDVLVLDVLTSTGFSWFLLNSCCSGIYHALSFIFGFVTIAYYYPGGDPLKIDQAWLTSRVSIFFSGGEGRGRIVHIHAPRPTFWNSSLSLLLQLCLSLVQQPGAILANFLLFILSGERQALIFVYHP